MYLSTILIECRLDAFGIGLTLSLPLARQICMEECSAIVFWDVNYSEDFTLISQVGPTDQLFTPDSGEVVRVPAEKECKQVREFKSSLHIENKPNTVHIMT